MLPLWTGERCVIPMIAGSGTASRLCGAQRRLSGRRDCRPHGAPRRPRRWCTLASSRRASGVSLWKEGVSAWSWSSRCCYRNGTYMKLMPTMPRPTTTILVLALTAMLAEAETQDNGQQEGKRKRRKRRPASVGRRRKTGETEMGTEYRRQSTTVRRR